MKIELSTAGKRLAWHARIRLNQISTRWVDTETLPRLYGGLTPSP